MIRVLLMYMFIVSSTHDIHFSKSTMNYNEETQTLQVVINVFTDDLELAIERTHQELDLEIGAKHQHEHTDSLVGNYVLNHIMFSTNNQKLDFDFIGFEYDYDICYLYLESQTFTTYRCTSNEINVNLFFEVYNDQENVCELHTPHWDEEFIFTRRASSFSRYCDQ